METEERGRRRALFIGTALEGGEIGALRIDCQFYDR
jgi:hypothetical protein